MIKFSLQGHSFILLHNLLKVTGLCENGGKAKYFISLGAVSVDGVVELRKGCKIFPGQIVQFKTHSIQVLE